MEHVIYALVAGGAVLATWDAARRYIAGKQLLQREVDRIIALEFKAEKQREALDNLGSKLGVVQQATTRASQRIGGLR